MDVPRDDAGADDMAGGVAGRRELPAELPPWQIVRERRATFAATPRGERQAAGGARPNGTISFLAGDWTATGLPATLESAVRSGNRAAELVVTGGA